VNDAVGAHSLFEKIFYTKGNGCCGFAQAEEKEWLLWILMGERKEKKTEGGL
jgi:hypothetical protein